MPDLVPLPADDAPDEGDRTALAALKNFVGGPDGGPFLDPAQETQTLKYYFTPRAPIAGEMERLRDENPHAKTTTQNADVADELRGQFGDAIGEVTAYAGETTVYVARDAIVEVCQALYDAGFTYMSDMGTLDRFTEEDRFEVFYNLVAMERGRRLRLKVRVDEEDAVIPTVTGIWPGAGWHEREAWDMMGVRFEGHPDHRRVYMPEDFAYHPARKEFPTIGIPGSLPLPPNAPDGALQPDPYPRAHGLLPANDG